MHIAHRRHPSADDQEQRVLPLGKVVHTAMLPYTRGRPSRAPPPPSRQHLCAFGCLHLTVSLLTSVLRTSVRLSELEREKAFFITAEASWS